MKLMGAFGIDDGELDGLTPQQCFVLGYELAQIDNLLAEKEGFERTIHAQNLERLKLRCRRSRRKFRVAWCANDKSENWLTLRVWPE